MKNYSLKNRLSRIVASILCFCMVFSFFSFPAHFAKRSLNARAADEKVYTEFNTAITLSNGQFTGTTTTAPITPNGWTGGYIGGETGNVVSGIIGLDATYTQNFDALKLGRYPEFEKATDVPDTPFGFTSPNPATGSFYPGTNKNVLMINTDGSDTAYGYSTTDISLSANSYYKFSAWVKTGKFGDKQGAAFTLTGLDQPVGIWNIDTVYNLPKDERTKLPILDIYNNYGFTLQTIYLATGPNSETVKINLSVGDYADIDHHFESNGYAFFDNVTAYQLSPTNYHFETINIKDAKKDNVIFYDMNPSSLLIAASEKGDLDKTADGEYIDVAAGEGAFIEAGSFSNGKNGWEKIEKTEDDDWVDPLTWDVYNGAGVFVKDLDVFGLVGEPHTPSGQYDPLKHQERRSNNIMVLSSFEQDETYKTVSAGIKSGAITVEKEKYYRLSAWYNTQNGATATVAVSGRDTSFLGKLGPYTNSGLSSDGNNARYGWQRTTFYIKGSAFENVEIYVELWLGGGEKTSGIAMFDDVTFEEITFRQYADNLFGGTQISIDNNNSSGTGVTNGDFAEMDFEDEISYPLAPSGWKFIDTATAGTAGFSDTLVETDDAIYGVAPAQTEHYLSHQNDNYNGIPNPRPEGLIWENVNVLLMHSPTDTAFGYRSGEINIPDSSAYKLSVTLRTKLTGFGAALILKNGNSVVASIEGIDSLDNWKTYSFYLAGAGASASLNLEIWFGMTDKEYNQSKLSSGHMFVDTVKLESLSAAGEIEARLTEYNTAAHPSDLDFAVYCAGAYDLNAYDRYDDTSAVKQLYDMNHTHGSDTQSRAGVIATLPAEQNVIPSYYYDAHAAVPAESRFNNCLYLENVTDGWSKFESKHTISLAADVVYYRIDFSVMVDLGDADENAVGAGIWLGTDGITDIRNTYHSPVLQGSGGTPIYELEFQTFSFYYKVGSTNESLNWAVTLGDRESPDHVISGRVYLNYISVNAIDQTTYDKKSEEFKAAAEDDEIDDLTNIAIIDKTVEPIETPPAEEEAPAPATGCNNMSWQALPAILFAVAILIALFVVAFKKFKARRPRNRAVSKVASYDRNELRLPSDESETEQVKVIRASDNIYERFDEFEELEETETRREKTRATIAEPASDTQAEPVEPQAEEEVPSVFDNEFDD